MSNIMFMIITDLLGRIQLQRLGGNCPLNESLLKMVLIAY